MLDLADGELRVGNVDAARTRLASAAVLQEQRHANRWRHGLRYQLLRGRLALARGDAEEARAIAAKLRIDSEQIGVARYADLAFLLEVEAAAALGEPFAAAATETVLERLPRHAGLEAWWLAAEAAAATHSDRFQVLAEDYAARLAAHAGQYAERFSSYAGARLERIRTVGLHG